MNQSGDDDELLHHLLKNIAQEQLKFQINHNAIGHRRAATSADNDEDVEMMTAKEVEFDAEEFERRVRLFHTFTALLILTMPYVRVGS